MNTTDTNNSVSDTAIEWLVRLQSEELSSNEEQLFYAWLEKSSAHQRAYIEAEWLWQRAEVSETPLRKADSAENISATNNNVIALPLSKRILPRALAASLAFFMVGLLSLMFLDYKNNQYTTAVGDQLDFVLEDGSHLYLNTDSSVRADIDEKRRLIVLNKGEVFFDVAKDSSRPFMVKTESGIVRVLGTRFNVLSGPQGSTVTVLEGSVGVTSNLDVKQVAEQQFATEARLSQDQQTTILGDQVAQIQNIADADRVVAWREGKLIYNGESFVQVLQDISRYFEGEIRVGDAVLENLKVVAVLQLQDKESTLQVLEETFNLASVETSKELTLLYPKK